MRESFSPAANAPSSFFLDYGADAHQGNADLEVSRHGMHFNCRWQFQIGTHLSFSVHLPENPLQIIQITGFVVESYKLKSELYRIGLLFEEATPEQRRLLKRLCPGARTTRKSRPTEGGTFSPGQPRARA